MPPTHFNSPPPLTFVFAIQVERASRCGFLCTNESLRSVSSPLTLAVVAVADGACANFSPRFSRIRDGYFMHYKYVTKREREREKERERERERERRRRRRKKEFERIYGRQSKKKLSMLRETRRGRRE